MTVGNKNQRTTDDTTSDAVSCSTFTTTQNISRRSIDRRRKPTHTHTQHTSNAFYHVCRFFDRDTNSIHIFTTHQTLNNPQRMILRTHTIHSVKKKKGQHQAGIFKPYTERFHRTHIIHNLRDNVRYPIKRNVSLTCVDSTFCRPIIHHSYFNSRHPSVHPSLFTVIFTFYLQELYRGSEERIIYQKQTGSFSPLSLHTLFYLAQFVTVRTC